MNCFKKLEEQGWEGGDESLEISLLEYGLIWKKVDENYSFVYKVLERTDENNYSFGRSDLTTEILKESWISIKDVEKFAGEHLLDLPFPIIISILVDYYGKGNVFGITYHPIEEKNLCQSLLVVKDDDTSQEKTNQHKFC